MSCRSVLVDIGGSASTASSTRPSSARIWAIWIRARHSIFPNPSRPWRSAAASRLREGILEAASNAGDIAAADQVSGALPEPGVERQGLQPLEPLLEPESIMWVLVQMVFQATLLAICE